MIALNGVRCFYLSYNHQDLVPRISRSQLSFPRRLSFARSSFDYEVFGFPSSRLVSPSILTAEKVEAKAVLTLFLKKQGLSDAAAESTVNKSDLFIDHLVSRLPYLHQSRNRVGRELSTLEIRDALIPYLESFVEEHCELLVDFVENFHKPPSEGKPIRPICQTPESQSHKQGSKMAVEQVHDKCPDGTLRPNVVHLMKLGLDLKHIEEIARKHPHLPALSLEQELIPTVEFLLDLGVHKSDLHSILKRENSKKKIVEVVGFFYEMGVPTNNAGKILIKYPKIATCSVEDSLLPAAKFFHSLGINVALLLYQYPNTFGLSTEKHLKPIAEFFLANGFSTEDLARMIASFGDLWSYKLATLSRKYDFFLTLGYPREELVRFPVYFNFSLEGRLKPRFELVKESGLKLSLSQVVRPSDDKFHSGLEKKVRKLHYSNSPRDKGPDGTLRPNIVYLMNLGLDLKQIEEMGQKYPYLRPLSLEQNLIPAIEFLLNLGVRKSSIPYILICVPGLCKDRTLEKLNSAAAFLESLGVDKNDCGRVIEGNPMILCTSKKKIVKIVGFLYQVGVPAERVGKIFTKYPGIACKSVEDNLLPTAKFFHSFGINVALLLCLRPEAFGRSTEKQLKPIAEFFLTNGFSNEDFARMTANDAGLWTFNVATLSRKYDYFLTLGYPREDLIKCAVFFNFSVEGRLKPRFKLVEESGLKLSLSQVIRPTDDQFHSRLAKKLRQLHSGNTLDVRNDA